MSGIRFDFDSETDHLNIYDETTTSLLELSSDDVWMLVNYWVDGFCVCGEEIPQDHIICRSCLGQAMNAWGIREVR